MGSSNASGTVARLHSDFAATVPNIWKNTLGAVVSESHIRTAQLEGYLPHSARVGTEYRETRSWLLTGETEAVQGWVVKAKTNAKCLKPL